MAKHTKYAIRFADNVVVTRTSLNTGFTFCRCVWETEAGTILSKGFGTSYHRLKRENAAAFDYWQERCPDLNINAAVVHITVPDKSQA